MLLANAHPFRSAASAVAGAVGRAPARSRIGAGAACWRLLCSGVAVAALPRAAPQPASDEPLQWQALAIAPLSAGGRTGLRLVATEPVEPIDFAPDRPTVELSMTLGRGDSLRRSAGPRRRALSPTRDRRGADRGGRPGHRRRDRRVASCSAASNGGDRAGRAASRLRAGLGLNLQSSRGRDGAACTWSASRSPSTPARCASAAGSATGSTGRCAPPACRRSRPPNICARWRPRSTSAATSRPTTASTWSSPTAAPRPARASRALALRRHRPRRRRATCNWSNGRPHGRADWIDAGRHRPADRRRR